MKTLIRRAWPIEHSALGTPRFSVTHIFEEGSVTALCGRALPPRERDSAVISGAGTPLCQLCAKALVRGTP